MPKTKYVDFKAVKATVSMLQILDHYGLTERFKRSGDSLSGRCPLHKGENPSQFRVSIPKNCWNCFGQCKRGGNVLDFVSLKESVSVREAALSIAEWFSLSLEDSPNDGGPEKKTEGATPERPKARSKSDTTSDHPGPNKPLGFQLQNLDILHPYFTERGLTEATIAEFGLGFCDSGSMNGRVVIPIHNSQGQLLAYAGRWPGEAPEGTPKYKLPAGFKKAQELFNLHRTIRESPDAPLVVVEGFFDCIKLCQNGVKRVVALMGSTLSPAQEELICKYANPTGRIVIMLDEDDAGRAGREQIVQRLAPRLFVKVHAFEQEGRQPEDLTAEEASAFLGCSLSGRPATHGG